jgi:hypothetical protein
MKTTGIFTIQEHIINAPLGEPLYLIPFGDIHRDSDMFALDYWRRFLDRASSLPNAIFLGMGDYCDGVSTSERSIIKDERLHETTKRNIETFYRETNHKLAKELSFMDGKLIGLLGGNHYYPFDDGSTSDHMLADLMKTKYLGVCSFIRLTIRDTKSNHKSASIDIFAHHGKGGGGSAGATFSTLDKMQQTADADIFLMGHDHKRGVVPSNPRIKISRGNGGKLHVKERTPWLGRTGSFLKAYENGSVSYNVDCGRSPASLGWIEFELTPIRSQSNGDKVSIRIRGIS